MNGRDLSVGLFATGFRAGVAAGRVASLPVRVLARTPGVRPIVLELGERISEEGADTRARVRDRSEAATSTVSTPELERLIQSVLDGPLADVVARRLVDRMLAGPELDRVVEHVVASPALRAAVTQQGTTLAGEVAEQLRTRSTALDDRQEARARALVRRPPRAAEAATHAYAGLATRAVGFAVDLALAGVAFLAAAALAALALSLIGRPDAWVGAALLGTLWVLAAGTYFVVFWSSVGQTPGLRIVGQRVVRGDGPPGVGRSVVRFLVLVLGLLPVLVSAVLVLLDGRRRALHDVVAGTVVVAAGPAR